MIKNGVAILIILVSISLLCAVPVTAAITTINQGNVVFIGEEGLDISAAMGPDTRIGWWASAAEITTTSPTVSVDLAGRITSFMVTPAEFSGYTGNWYRLDSLGKANGVAFLVAEPQLAIRAEDTTVEVAPELNWIPTGDDIRFRIDNNLAQMLSQRGSPPLITIKVQSPDGAVYTSLLNAGGMPTSIENIPVTATRYYTGSIWNMGNPDYYPPGTYTIWAESNVNHMMDNYDVPGKTVSIKTPLLNQGVNPLITKATTLVTQTTKTPLPVTTLPTTEVPTVVSTTETTLSPTELPTTAPESLTTAATNIPSPTQTQAPGFGAVLAVSAMISGLAVYLKKK